MDDVRWQRIDALFDAALDLPEEGRRELLDRQCGDDPELRRAVERLLALEVEAGDFLGDPSLESRGDAAAAVANELAGTRIGPYRLIRPLGHGGMGTVYLAQREDDYRHEVAVKLVRRSLLSHEARRRLHAERQVLARLEHPNVARLYDGGTTDDGLPYLVMERVDGLPIDRYCERHRSSVRQRLELVLQVLAAVAHAHHHLRVHCDIKPSNILVTEDGTPKLLDFGIAKLLSPEEQMTVTSTGLRPLTPAYASPEQILGGPITTASDLYSVGVLLYELLCGSLPYGVGTESEVEMSRAIVERDPAPPSRRIAAWRRSGHRDLERQLRGDLDAIVSKAIRKEPGRRYSSAEAFADDVTRHLDARPVLARKGTWRYRGGRFLRRLLLPPDPRRRRERWGWATVLMVFAALAALGLSLRQPAAWCPDPAAQLRGVWDAPRRATVEQAFRAVRLPFAADTLRRVTSALDVYAQRWVATEREICEATLVRGERSARLLDLGRLCLDGRREELRTLVDLFSAPDDGLVIDAVGAVHQLGDLSACTDQAELATRRLPPADPAVRRRLQRVRTVTEAQNLRLRVAQPVDFMALRHAEAELRQLDDPALLARLLHVLGLAESREKGDSDAGVAHLEEALRAAIAGGDRPQQTRIYAALIKTLARQQGDFERARFWEGFATASLESLSPGYPDVEVDVYEALGVLNWESGRMAASRDFYRRAVDSAEKLGDPTQQISALNQLGMFEVEPVYRAIEIIERELGPNHVRLASPLMNAAAHLAFQGEYDEALSLVRRSYELRRATFGDRHPDLGYPLILTAQLLLAEDRPGEALAPLARALDLLEPAFGSKAQIVRDAHVGLAEAQLLAGHLPAALAHAAAAEDGLPPGVAPDHPSRLNLLRVVGDVRRGAGDVAGALERHEELLVRFRAPRSEPRQDAAASLWSVARTFLAAGRPADAVPLLEEALAAVRDVDRWHAAGIRVSLAEAVADEDPEQARRLVAEARERLSGELTLHRELLREIEARWGG